MVNPVDEPLFCIGMRNIIRTLVPRTNDFLSRNVLGKPAGTTTAMPDTENFFAHGVILCLQYFRNIAAAAQRALCVGDNIAHARQRKQSFS